MKTTNNSNNGNNNDANEHFLTISNLHLFIIYALVFYIVNAGFCFNFFGYVDDMFVGSKELIYLANGRWCAWIIKFLLGYGPAYPHGVIFMGLMLSLSIVFQVSVLRIRGKWAKIAYGVILICAPENAANISLWCMNTAFGVGILAASISMWYLTYSSSRKRLLFSCCLLTISLGCYQSLGTIFGALVVCRLIICYIRNDINAVCRLAKNAAFVVLVSLFAYYIIYYIFREFAPATSTTVADNYQNGIVGWEVFSHGAMATLKVLVINAVINPLKHMLSMEDGRWMICVCGASIIAILVHYIKQGLAKQGMVIAFAMLVLLQIPYVFCAILLSHIGLQSRLMISLPVVVSFIWVITYCVFQSKLSRYNSMCFAVLSFTFVVAIFNTGEYIRDRYYKYERAMEELREMYMMGRVEAIRNGMNECDILLCGKPGKRDANDSLEMNADRACSMILAIPSVIPGFERFLRIPSRMRVLNNEETIEYGSKLEAMPSWPADGSISSSGNVILIKVGEM